MMLTVSRKSLKTPVEYIRRRANALIAPRPPALQRHYSRDDYREFMMNELLICNAAYVRGRVVVTDRHHLEAALSCRSVILGLIHQGSWILIGGVMRYVLKIPYTVLASRRNFPLMSPEEAKYWKRIHQTMAAFYGQQVYFTDQSARPLFRWLKESGQVLGVAFDVREWGHYPPEQQIAFNNRTIWVQTGPAKLARATKSVIVPASIHYDVKTRVHMLRFCAQIDPQGTRSDIETTERVFAALEEDYNLFKNQEFHPLLEIFSNPHVRDEIV